MTKEEIGEALTGLGLRMEAEFVPFSKSRNKAEKEPSLNWRVTILRVASKEPVIETDYSAGVGHTPAYKTHKGKFPGDTYGKDRIAAWECEHGKRGWLSEGMDTVLGFGGAQTEAIMPDFVDVMASLTMDAEAIDYATYEEWADNIGYDRDSRKGEAIYRTCLTHGLKLRSVLGEEGFRKLREIYQDY